MSTIYISPDLSSYSPLNLSLTQWLCVFCCWVRLAPSQVLGFFPERTKGYMTYHRKVIYNPGNIQLQITKSEANRNGVVEQHLREEPPRTSTCTQEENPRPAVPHKQRSPGQDQLNRN